jgi:hypothetical protein
VIDAFANGWRVGPGCTEVAITFGPQSLVDDGYLAGALACFVLALVLLAGARSMLATRASADTARTAAELPKEAPAPPWSPRRTLVAGAVAALVFGFLFGLRAGAVIGPAYALILWRGLSTRRLILAAGALLVIVVPLLYLLFPGDDQGGYDTGYPSQHLAAHWVTVGAFALLALALWRTLSWARSTWSPSQAVAPPADLGP